MNRTRGPQGLAADVRVAPARQLSRVHWTVPVFLFLPAIAIALARRSSRMGAGEALLWALGGYVFWTLTEYWLHRIVFHFEPDDGHRRAAALDHPRRPPRPSERPAAARDAAVGQHPARGRVLRAVRARARRHAAPPFAPASWSGYLVYDMLHYYVHHLPARTATRGAAQLHELHMRHHFQDHDARLRRQRALLGPRLRHGAEARGAGRPGTRPGCIATDGLCRARVRGL